MNQHHHPALSQHPALNNGKSVSSSSHHHHLPPSSLLTSPNLDRLSHHVHSLSMSPVSASSHHSGSPSPSSAHLHSLNMWKKSCGIPSQASLKFSIENILSPSFGDAGTGPLPTNGSNKNHSAASAIQKLTNRYTQELLNMSANSNDKKTGRSNGIKRKLNDESKILDLEMNNRIKIRKNSSDSSDSQSSSSEYSNSTKNHHNNHNHNNNNKNKRKNSSPLPLLSSKKISSDEDKKNKSSADLPHPDSTSQTKESTSESKSDSSSSSSSEYTDPKKIILTTDPMKLANPLSLLPDGGGKDGVVWPAWVYCTRYSDRPSSGKRNDRFRIPCQHFETQVTHRSFFMTPSSYAQSVLSKVTWRYDFPIGMMSSPQYFVTSRPTHSPVFSDCHKAPWGSGSGHPSVPQA